MGAGEAVAAPAFNLQALQATTNPVAVWMIINGPAAQRLGINSTFNCLGEGAWANATIGRAMRLILRNVGSALPGGMDRATHGQPGKYSFCCAENEEANPWEPLHVERGFPAQSSTVTVVGAEGNMNMNSHSKDAEDLLRAFAETMIHPPSNEYFHGGEPWLIIGPEHAEVMRRAGLTKRDVKKRLWEQSKMRADRLTKKDFAHMQNSRAGQFKEIKPESMIPIARDPADVSIIVAGGPGTHTVYIPCFGNSRAITREVVYK